MEKLIFKKELSATGKGGTIKAEIIATMNCGTKTICGTNALTHDEYERKVPTHKVEVFVEGKLWSKSDNLDTDSMVLYESEKYIKDAKNYILKLANKEPIKSFNEKMNELFDSSASNTNFVLEVINTIKQ